MIKKFTREEIEALVLKRRRGSPVSLDPGEMERFLAETGIDLNELGPSAIVEGEEAAREIEGSLMPDEDE